MSASFAVVPAALPPDLLDYRFSTLPAPLQISTATAESPAAINLCLTPPTGTTVYCNKVVIAVPLGDDDVDLCTKAPSLTPNTTWWAISSVARLTGEALGLDNTISYAIFTAVCPSNLHWKIDYDLQFSLITPGVNRKEGTFGLVIVETSGASETGLEQRRTVFGLAKSPAVEYLSEVVTTAAPPAPTDKPTSEFAAGQAIRLAWESNATSFALRDGSAATPIWTGTDTSYVVAQGVLQGSTFSVVAVGGATRTQAASVTVVNPTITPAAVTAGSVTVTGASIFHNVTAVSLSAGPLGVTGAAELPAGVQTSALATYGGTTVTGGLTAAGVNVTELLVAAKDTTVQSASVDWLTVTGKVATLKPSGLWTGSFIPSSDGLVLGYVGAPLQDGKRCAAIVTGRTAATGQLAAHGGNGVYSAGGKDSSMGPVYGSFTLPVCQGVPFTLAAAQQPGRELDAPLSFLWVPFAINGTVRSIAEEEALASGLQLSPLPEPVYLEAPTIGGDLSGLLGFFADVLGERLTPDQTQRLKTAVVALTARPYAPNHPQSGASS